MKNYDDIINLPHHTSKKHPRMARENRAAQFAPFTALTGHVAAVKETERLTEERVELSDNALDILNRKLQIIYGKTESIGEVTITYFQPDNKKSGGKYITAIGTVRKINEQEKMIIMNDGTEIFIDRITDIDFLAHS